MIQHGERDSLRVLYVAHNKGDLGGGAGLALFQMMTAMKERYNVIPTILLPMTPDPKLLEACADAEIEAFYGECYYNWLTKKDLSHRIKGVIKYFLNRIYFFPKVFRMMAGREFDIVHSNCLPVNLGYFLAKHFGIPHVWHIREDVYGQFKLRHTWPDSYVRSVYHSNAAMIAISRFVYDIYVNNRRLCDPENTRLIYDGLIVPEEYEKVYMHDGRVNFCLTGNLYDHKKQATAVRACARLKDFANRFTLHIIGNDTNSYAEELKNLATSYGLEDCVKFWGFRSDVDKILRDMDVGLMPSRCEAFGRVTVEHMMHYMPVIGSDSGATPEIVTDGETGFIFPLDDDEKLAELMRKFINNPELIPSMGKSARERAVKKFSLEHNIDEIYSLYQEILGR